MDYAGVNAQQFGVLVAFEMVTAMVCYIPVAHLADKHGRRPFVLATFVFFTLFPVTLLWAKSFGWLALAFVVRGLKEFGEPARKALIIGEAVPELRARTYGAYYLIRDCVVTSGSFLGAWLWGLSPSANFHRRGFVWRPGNSLVLVVCLSGKTLEVHREPTWWPCKCGGPERSLLAETGSRVMLSTMNLKSFDASLHDRIAGLGQRVLAGGDITREEGRWLFSLETSADIVDLLSWANRIREHFKGNKIHLCSIVNIKAGGCSENCRFCAQAATYQTDSPRYGLIEAGADSRRGGGGQTEWCRGSGPRGCLAWTGGGAGVG